MTRIAAALLLFFTLVPSAWSQQQIPPASLDRLQTAFSTARDDLWEINDGFWHSGEFEQCVAMMRLITQIDPRDVEAYDDGAWLMQNSFLDREAEAFLRIGLSKTADIYDLYYSLGFFLYMHERHEEAIPYLLAATTFEVPFFVWNTLAHAYELAGYPDQALEIWLEREYAEPDYNVNTNQIDRILAGEAPPNVPATIQRWRAERKAEEGK